MLRAGSKESLNLQGAYIEVLTDMLGSVGVIVAAIVWGITGWAWVDPVIGAAIGVFILPRAWKLGREAVRVLVQAAPAGLDLTAMQSELAGIGGVGIDSHAVLDQARELLAGRHGITHATLQVEPDDHHGCEDVSW